MFLCFNAERSHALFFLQLLSKPLKMQDKMLLTLSHQRILQKKIILRTLRVQMTMQVNYSSVGELLSVSKNGKMPKYWQRNH
jgi:hypothetical protein